MNIWGSYGGYEGRLVICEIDSSLEPGQLVSAEYLAEMVRFVLEKRGHMENTYKRALEVMLVGMIQGKKFSDSEIASRIEQCGWKTEDSYVCIRLDAEEQEGNPGSSAASLCNYVEARVQDATVYDPDSEQAADIVIADVPCSGYGVIGKKPEIKYRATPQKQEEIVMLQRMILDKAAKYVKPDGTLIFSTCTIAREENEENVLWFLKNYPYRLESLDPYIPEELHCKSTKLGYLQLLPGIHKTDGFFIARFRRK